MKPMYMVLMTLALLSCRNNSDDKPVAELTSKVQISEPELSDSSANTAAADEQVRADSDKRKQLPKGNATPPADWTQKIIKTANVSIELKDYHAYNNAVHHSLATYGAYIAQEQQQEDEAEIVNDLSIKVPVEQFENLLNFLTSDRKNKLLQKQITTSDVTAEYADTRSRLETKKQVREKYHQFMANANKIDDVLRLQSEINAITEDIEAAAGRVKYLGHQASYSTINLRYFQVLDVSKKSEDEPGFIREIANAFKAGTAFLGEILVGLTSVWPLLILLALAWVVIRRKGLLRSKPHLNK